MIYLFIYIVFAYLFVLGVVLGEIMNDVKPNGWQLATFVFAPVFLPIVLGMYFVSYLNRGADMSTQGTIDVKVTNSNP